MKNAFTRIILVCFMILLGLCVNAIDFVTGFFKGIFIGFKSLAFGVRGYFKGRYCESK